MVSSILAVLALLWLTRTGLLDLVESKHLIVITRREQVASIRGKAVYAIRGVTIIPLESRDRAQGAVDEARKRLKAATGTAAANDTDESDVEEEEAHPAVNATETSQHEQQQQQQDADALEPPREEGRVGLDGQQQTVFGRGSTLAKGLVQQPGKYGHFAAKWFRGKSSKPDDAAPAADVENAADADSTVGRDALEHRGSEAEGNTSSEVTSAEPGVPEKKDNKPEARSTIQRLEPRILRSARLYFSSAGFYFSYDYDLSGTLTQRETLTSSQPLRQRFDNLYFWNRNMTEPLINKQLDDLVLPLLQGFVGQRTFSIATGGGVDGHTVADAAQLPEEVVAAQATPSKATISDEGTEARKFILTLVSPRALKRNGLRFLRRGVADGGNVANTVETEQILSPLTWDVSDKVCSLVQLRGSIPLHFSQTPGTSSKPTPQLFGSEATNDAAFKKHFEAAVARYRDVHAVSLIDRHPPELAIGESYEKHAKQLNESGGIQGKAIGFEWFDFHTVCKGMKFENVSVLLESLQEVLKSFKWNIKQDDRNICLQQGVIRTNCMDCLDRTNVVQAAIGGWALEQQLGELGLHIDLKSDPKTQWFNTLWAENGDAISKQYAGTAALKGDYTRTRKRNWTGALSDLSLTLSRYYNNVFGDYFMQANLDYWLGKEGPEVYEEFETNMMTKDYALDIRRLRQNAIEACMKSVLEESSEGETAGWTLSCPSRSNTLRSFPFEECVVLLTSKAFYFCRFDWNTEKVGGYERVDLQDIKEIWRGPYITSALTQAHLDEKKNCGFALRYGTGGRSIIRTNTRSLQNEHELANESTSKDHSGKPNTSDQDQTRLLAFKALPPSSSAASDDVKGRAGRSEVELIEHVTDQLREAIASSGGPNATPEVERRDVISVVDAKKNTGYIESLGNSFKRLIWA